MTTNVTRTKCPYSGDKTDISKRGKGRVTGNHLHIGRRQIFNKKICENFQQIELVFIKFSFSAHVFYVEVFFLWYWVKAHNTKR